MATSAMMTKYIIAARLKNKIVAHWLVSKSEADWATTT